MTTKPDERSLKIFVSWLIPISAICIAIIGVWVRFVALETELSDHREHIAELQRDAVRIIESGAEGFIHPVTHSSHDNQIRHFLEEQFGKRGWLRLLSEYGNSVHKE